MKLVLPLRLTTDKHPAYTKAVRWIVGRKVLHRHNQYLNNRIAFCQNSASGQNSIIPHLLRRSINVLPTLPVYVRI